MNRNTLRRMASRSLALLVALTAAWRVQAQDAQTKYPTMASLDHYMMERNAEIELARSAAPESISHDAEVMVLGQHGYEIAVQGKNGFVCLVERSWSAGFDDPEFWNPKLRSPICFNPPAARFNIPLLKRKAALVIAAQSKDQISKNIQSAFEKKEVPPLEPGAMCYMLSKLGYLSDRDGRWHPHLMYFVPDSKPTDWGAGLPGSPVVGGFTDKVEPFTTYLVPVGEWSDGTPAPMDEH
jgi:hypothetical protein